MTTTNRMTEHQRNDNLERLLSHLNADLARIGEPALPEGSTPTKPTVFLVGCARSGTTLALQWLANLGHFSWPTNFISRFHAAPWVGARVQQMLADPDYDFRGELTLGTALNPDPFASRLGKTQGLMAPNEFWYWWRRFLPESDTHQLNSRELASIDQRRLCAELAAWQQVTNKPLALKALIMNENLEWLAEAVPGSVFIHVTRDRFMNAQSLLEARRAFHGDINAWYSFRPAAYALLKDLPAAEQVVGQIHHTEAAIAKGLAEVSPERQLVISYKELCRNPQQIYAQLQALMSQQGCPLPETYQGPAAFPARQNVRLDDSEAASVHQAWKAYPSCD